MKKHNWKELNAGELHWKTMDSKTQADTFIEWCFEQKCAGISQGSRILNEWRLEKERYCSYTRTTIFDFQHYSRHDESHSINILNAIDMVLGKKRIKLLSVADLWGILESAYFHDIGMALSYEELKSLWTSDEQFKVFIHKSLAGENADLKKAAAYYGQIGNLLESRPQMEGIDDANPHDFTDGWPIEFQRCIVLLTAEYIRKHHADRSKEKMMELFGRNDKVSAVRVISDRLYKIVAEISCLHGKEFKDISCCLSYKEIGFDTESMHPQFIAAMLRLGDLLDMDNNRFDLRAIEHFGSLPYVSSLHYKKHKAMKHFDITPRVIEAKAMSKDKAVCRMTRQWFDWLEKEVEDLICDWNRFAPKELRGCLLQRCRLEVYYGDTLFDEEQVYNYNVDKNRLLKLIEGSSLYQSEIDCLREYLQNALDASKMQMWLEIKSDDMIADVCPYDIESQAFDAKTIDIGVLVDMMKQEVVIRIQDKGIGMERECIEALSVVGKSWKQRGVFLDEIEKMPDWLRPTGGFGIGMQSAFMLTDEVIIHSKSEKEVDGYEVHLYSPQQGGNVTKQRFCSANQRRGTKIEFKVKLSKLYRLMEDFREPQAMSRRKTGKKQKRHESLFLEFGYQKNDDRFMEAENEEYICSFLDYYIRKTIPDTLFPINISADEKKGETVNPKRKYSTYKSPYASRYGGFGFYENYLFKNDEETEEKRYLYNMDSDMTVRIWDKKENINICIMCWPDYLGYSSIEEEALLNPMCYKSVRVKEWNSHKLRAGIPDFLSICIDVMGRRMEEVLSVHRDSFLQSFDMAALVDKYLRIYIEIMTEAAVLPFAFDKTNPHKMAIREDENISMIGFTILAIIMRQKKGMDRLLTKWRIKDAYMPYKIMMKRIQGKSIENVWVDTAEALQNLMKLFPREPQERAAIPYTIVAADFGEKRENEDLFSLCSDRLPFENDELREIDALLKKSGTELYVFPPICNMLLRMAKACRKHYIRINEDQDNMVYVAIRDLGGGLENPENASMSEEEFLKNAFKLDVLKNRYIGENIRCKKYGKLRVRNLPGEKINEEINYFGNSYLISPIGYDMYINILKKIGIKNPEIPEQLEKSYDVKKEKYIIRNKFLRDDFVRMVKDSAEFNFIVKWTVEHQFQKGEKHLTREEIARLYSDMLGEIYQENFCNDSQMKAENQVL